MHVVSKSSRVSHAVAPAASRFAGGRRMSWVLCSAARAGRDEAGRPDPQPGRRQRQPGPQRRRQHRPHLRPMHGQHMRHRRGAPSHQCTVGLAPTLWARAWQPERADPVLMQKLADTAHRTPRAHVCLLSARRALPPSCRATCQLHAFWQQAWRCQSFWAWCWYHGRLMQAEELKPWLCMQNLTNPDDRMLSYRWSPIFVADGRWAPAHRQRHRWRLQRRVCSRAVLVLPSRCTVQQEYWDEERKFGFCCLRLAMSHQQQASRKSCSCVLFQSCACWQRPCHRSVQCLHAWSTQPIRLLILAHMLSLAASGGPQKQLTPLTASRCIAVPRRNANLAWARLGPPELTLPPAACGGAGWASRTAARTRSGPARRTRRTTSRQWRCPSTGTRRPLCAGRRRTTPAPPGRCTRTCTCCPRASTSCVQPSEAPARVRP